MIVLLLASCWRGGGATTDPQRDPPESPSFVARVQGLAELAQRTAALEPRLATTLRRILALASEHERTALHDQLQELADEVAQLAPRLRGARARGDDPSVLARIERELADAAVMLGRLREGLAYAHSVEELNAIADGGDEPRGAPAWPPWLDDPDRIDVVMSPVPRPTLSWRHRIIDVP